MIATIFSSFIATKLGKSLPSWAWEIVFIALLCGAVALFHHHQVVKHDASVRAIQKAADEKQAADAIAQITRRDEQIVAQLRKSNDEANSRIAADGNAIRVLGPGRSACRPAVSIPAGRPGAADPNPDAAGPQVPPADGADVSWGWLTDRAEEHDQLRAEVLSWRDWYAQLVKNWPKSK